MLYTPQTPLWNPTQVLGIINPDQDVQTCIGYAPSQGRRCRNPILASTRASIANTLDEISYLSPSSTAVLKKLRSIAAPCLCVRFHKGQAEDVVMEWQRNIAQLEPRKSVKNARCERVGTSRKHEVSREKSLEQQLREMHEMLDRMQEKLDSQYPDTDEQERKRRESKRKQEKERLEKEKEKAEQEQRERERQAQNERIRQRAEARQRETKRQAQEQARLEREKARKEREEWDVVWKSYQERWGTFKASPCRDREDIPWPVRRGERVDPPIVREFYRKAAPRDVDFAKCLKRESLKWHPNCPSSVENLRQLSGDERDNVEMICRVLTGLIDECAGKEAGCFE